MEVRWSLKYDFSCCLVPVALHYHGMIHHSFTSMARTGVLSILLYRRKSSLELFLMNRISSSEKDSKSRIKSLSLYSLTISMDENGGGFNIFYKKLYQLFIIIFMKTKCQTSGTTAIIKNTPESLAILFLFYIFNAINNTFMFNLN